MVEIQIVFVSGIQKSDSVIHVKYMCVCVTVCICESQTVMMKVASPALADRFFTTELPGKPLLLLLFSPSVQFSHSVVSDSL